MVPDKIYTPAYFGESDLQTFLGKAASSGHPLQFFINEDMITRYYRSRVPRWSPSLVLTPGGLRDRRNKQITLQRIEMMIEDQHIELINAVFAGQKAATFYQANYVAQEMAWTDELRRSGQLGEQQLSFAARSQRMIEEAQARRDRQMHEYAKEMLGIQQEHEQTMQKLRHRSVEDKMADMEHVNTRIRHILQDINESSDPDRVKNQRATTIIGLSAKVFD